MNMKGKHITQALLLPLRHCFLQHVRSDQSNSSLSLTLRLPNEPDCIHPIFSKSIYAAPIETLILLPPAEYDPVSLQSYAPSFGSNPTS
jgi:hypothetical protein